MCRTRLVRCDYGRAARIAAHSIEEECMPAEQSAWISTTRASLQDSKFDFFAVNARRYWLDFAVSLVIAYSAGAIFLTSPLLSWPQLLAFPLAVFWIYRLR